MGRDDRAFKSAIYEACMQVIQGRIEQAEYAIRQAGEASRDDTKSSAGDKYETTREMMQQEMDRHQRQLFEAKKVRFQLEQCRNLEIADSIQPGALVQTSKSLLYIAAGIGQVTVQGRLIMVVSPVSPIAQALLGKRRGEAFVFQAMEQSVEWVQ